MLVSIRKQLQIFNSVIISYCIYMVNDFFRCKWPFKMEFHFITMFKNISILISKGMGWILDPNISFTIIRFSTFPVKILNSFMTFTHIIFPFFGKWRPFFTSPVSYITIVTFTRTIFRVASRWEHLKVFTTDYAFCGYHIFSMIKRATFRFLTDTRLSVSTLLIAHLGHRKSVNPLDINIISFIF